MVYFVVVSSSLSGSLSLSLSPLSRGERACERGERERKSSGFLAMTTTKPR